MRPPLRDAVLITLLLISGCDAPATQRAITATPDFTPTPAPTPTPAQALDPAHLWIASDAPTRQVIAVSPDGVVRSAALPLNENQTASELTASPDGRYLAYLVWNAAAEQHGIAMWNLTEPFSRLIVQPLPGYAVASLMFSEDSSTLLYTQIKPPVTWRLESIPAGGGQSALLADQDSAPDLVQVEPFAWQTGRPIFMDVLMVDNTSAAGVAYEIYSLDPPTGALVRLTQTDDWILPGSSLSPDGAQLAYFAETVGAPCPAGICPGTAKVMSLSSSEAATLAAPEGGTVISMAWMPDSQHILLDLLSDVSDQSSQTFALVDLQSAPPWPQLPADPAREHLITYQPYGDGVAYTILPEADGDPWTLTLFADIGPDAVPQVIPLDRPDAGAPRILRVPPSIP